MSKNILLFLLTICPLFSLSAQYRMGLVPRISPDKAVYQKIGFNEVEIRYGSPRVKGRQIWGNLEEYGEVWRAGANNATTVSFSQNVLIDGMELKADTYALFVIPRVDSAWTVIFSKKQRQWGSFRYNADDDALRVLIEPQEAGFREELWYSIHSDGLGEGRIRFEWEKIGLNIDFTFDYIQEFITHIESEAGASDSKWVYYLQGAEFLLSEEKKLNTALNWLVDSEQDFEENGTAWHKGRSYFLGHIYWIRARIHAEQEYYELAIDYATHLMNFEGEKSYYKKKGEAKQVLIYVRDWKEKIENK